MLSIADDKQDVSPNYLEVPVPDSERCESSERCIRIEWRDQSPACPALNALVLDVQDLIGICALAHEVMFHLHKIVLSPKPNLYVQ